MYSLVGGCFLLPPVEDTSVCWAMDWLDSGLDEEGLVVDRPIRTGSVTLRETRVGMVGTVPITDWCTPNSCFKCSSLHSWYGVLGFRGVLLL